MPARTAPPATAWSSKSAGRSSRRKSTGTGTWDDYRGLTLGTVKLAAGQGELLVRSDGPIKGALLDLRGVRLVPVK